ncbi:glutaredoxin-like protein / Cg6 protein [Babesia microti strain RI]|uniref:Glutaredoxin-like protein / Cg6 protein n=1 Tax=Babesia microti (strain RI) TaxID=1133968 RepID=A0A1R4AC34_BABMR|nr:glutaredoxin-like protein / Cg6 protein [Babesia microti strain RI]SJK86581.1 glutaredoxin-like protein / Cg6 protein [Babesia microti strain RI]|eukprot:XP_021338721.1 glutaredoxin-like protein / Cg6 protein [Babesia microti strain RI]
MAYLLSTCYCNCNYLLMSSLKNNSYYTNEHIRIINETVSYHKIVLFMKGNAREPKCKYSKRALDLLKSAKGQVIKTVNVLESEGVRNGVKIISGYPTFPQLFVNGKFIGGVDTMEQMYHEGKLQGLIQM